MPEKRSHYENIAKERGYDAVSAITSSLSVLVALDPNGGSSKLKKAAKAGIEIMGLEEWLSSSGISNIEQGISNDEVKPASPLVDSSQKLSDSPHESADSSQDTAIDESPCASVPVCQNPSTAHEMHSPAEREEKDDPFGSMSQGSFDF